MELFSILNAERRDDLLWEQIKDRISECDSAKQQFPSNSSPGNITRILLLQNSVFGTLKKETETISFGRTCSQLSIPKKEKSISVDPYPTDDSN